MPVRVLLISQLPCCTAGSYSYPEFGWFGTKVHTADCKVDAILDTAKHPTHPVIAAGGRRSMLRTVILFICVALTGVCCVIVVSFFSLFRIIYRFGPLPLREKLSYVF